MTGRQVAARAPDGAPKNAGHFLEEDQGPALAAVVDDFIRSTAEPTP